MTVKLRSPFIGSSKRRSRTSFYRAPRTTTCLNKSKASNIKVCVRIRPLNEFEKSHTDSQLLVRPLDSTVLVFDPYEAPPERYYKGRRVKDIGIRRNKDLKLAFDCVFDTMASNLDIFECTTKKMLDHLMDGVNCSIFAYGATGAGKTFTMLGTLESPGVISRTMNELYNRIENIKDDLICTVEISYLEIYNETVRDLLNPLAGPLTVREDGGSCLSISGLTSHKPTNAEHLFRMLEEGNQNRTQHPTDANRESSRSHAVFQLYLRQSPKTVDLSTDVLLSKMVLVDLAGSERATATKNCGDRMREGANINRSLLALGNCINALAEGKKGAHIPYRDSKLTRILKDALGGNCHTVMIANVSPCTLSYDDTQNTLKYADRAKHIKADLRKNVVRVDQHIHQYGKIVQELRSEVEEVKVKYKNAQATICELEMKLKKEKLDREAMMVTVEANGCRLLDEVGVRITEYKGLQDQLLSHEGQKILLKTKMAVRDRSQQYLNLLYYDPAEKTQDMTKTIRIQSQYQTKIQRLSTAIEELKFNLNDIRRCIMDKVKGLGPLNSDLHRSLANLYDTTRLQQLTAVDQLLQALLKIELDRSFHFDRAMCALCSIIHEQQLILSSFDRLNPSLKSKFNDVVALLQSSKDLTWNDDENRHELFVVQTLPDYILRLNSPRNSPNQDCHSSQIRYDNFTLDNENGNDFMSNKENITVLSSKSATDSSSVNSSSSVVSDFNNAFYNSQSLISRSITEELENYSHSNETSTFSSDAAKSAAAMAAVDRLAAALANKQSKSESTTISTTTDNTLTNVVNLLDINNRGSTANNGSLNNKNRTSNVQLKKSPAENRFLKPAVNDRKSPYDAKTLSQTNRKSSGDCPPIPVRKSQGCGSKSAAVNSTISLSSSGHTSSAFSRCTSAVSLKSATTSSSTTPSDDEFVFKKPAPPPPRWRIPGGVHLNTATTPSQQQVTTSARCKINAKSPGSTISSTASLAGASNLTKSSAVSRSPSYSNLKARGESSGSSFRMKKTQSTTQLKNR